MKIAIICDELSGGGAQRVVLALVKAFNADVYTEYINTPIKEINGININTILSKKRKDYFTFLSTFYSFWNFKRYFIKKKYDLYIFSGNTCINLVEKCKPNIWYCHTPNRKLYLINDKSMVKTTLKHIVGSYLYKFIFYKYDQYFAKNFDIIIANSNNVKERIFTVYGTNLRKKVCTIYPPVDIKGFKWVNQENYYLSFARLVPMKRVSLIVRAFRKMPNKRLIVVSTGSERKLIKNLAEDYPNIDIRGTLSDKELKNLVGSCIATIYIPFEEDFGISPVEGMAAGKPCIGVAEGGVKETVINGKTGYLCPANPNINDLIKAVNFMTSSRALSMRKACEERSRLFSKEIFLAKMEKIINSFILNLSP
jgi:glycosyltransferase involved in cell wall biosynthesis